MSAADLRVCHVITGLSTGGAEAMLLKLLTWRQAGARDAVVSLQDDGDLGADIRALGVPVTTIGLGTAVPRWAQWRRLRRSVAEYRPDVVLGWMYHGNLAAQFASGGAPVVWGIRQSFGGYRRERAGTRLAIWLGARYSSRPAAILYNSAVSFEQHAAIGYDRSHAQVIANGFDTERFRPDAEAPARLRRDLGIAPGAFVVGNVARWHPMKNHAGLIEAVLRARREGAPIHLVLAGANLDPTNTGLMRTAGPLLDQGALSLLGERRDVPRIVAGFDLFCSASQWGEGFPNAVGEAMACAVPCVVTDIGDSRMVVADTGEVLPDSAVVALAASLLHWARVADVDRRAAGNRARQRIVTQFGIDASGRTFYDALARAADPGQPETARSVDDRRR